MYRLKRKRIKWILLALLLVAAVLLASAWRWVPWLEDQRDMQIFFDHVASGAQQRYKPQAALSTQMLRKTDEDEEESYLAVYLASEEVEEIWNILVRMENPEKISRPMEQEDLLQEEPLVLSDWPEEPERLRFYETFFRAGANSFATCDNYAEIYQELRTYLLSLDAERFDSMYPWGLT